MVDYEVHSMYDDARYFHPESEDELELDTKVQIRDVYTEDKRLPWLLLGAAFFILIWTTIPVVVNFEYITPWFPGNALWRLFDPIITLPFNLFILTRSDIMNTGGRPRYWGALSERSVAWLLWSIGAGIYVQGHGIHLAAAMFKHPIQSFNLDHPELVEQYPVLEEMYSNMRDLWEHYIAHYMYAAGAMAMSWVQLFVFRNQVHGPLTKMTKFVWCFGSLVYGLLIAGVAIEFPHGLIVGLIYSIIIGLVTLAMLLLNKRDLPKGGLFTMGKYGLLNRKAAGIA